METARRLLFVLFVLAFSWPTVPTSAQSRPVDDAKRADQPDCGDAIGHTFTNQQFSDAQTNDYTSQTFFDSHAACSPMGMDGPALVAQCTGPVQLPVANANAAFVLCLVDAGGGSAGTVTTLRLDDFVLTSNQAKFKPDGEASRSQLARYNLAGSPKTIHGQGEDVGLVAFPVPESVAKEDLLLIWLGSKPNTPGTGDSQNREIIVHDREPDLVSLMQAAATSATTATSTTATGLPAPSFSGSSDDVTEPIDLPAGLSVIDASYQGEGNFAVIAHWNDQQDLLVNKIGSYSGRVALTLDEPASVIFEIQASGPWSIRVTPAG